jgi:hypothetical protein
MDSVPKRLEETMAHRYSFEREYRTAYSEGYTLLEDENEIGRVDLHFTSSATHATLCVPESHTDEEIQELISEIDDQLVMSHDPYREDFVVTVWAGRPAGIYSDEDEWDADEEEEDDEEEVDGNGHRP